MELYKELYELIGFKIQFKTAEGEYEGIIKYLLPKSHRVNIEHVYYMPTHKYMGNINFFLQEFLSYTVMDSSEKCRKVEKGDNLSQTFDRNCFGNRYRMNNLFDGKLDDDILYSDEITEDKFVLKLPQHLQSELPHDNIILETVDTDFHQAIKYISRQNEIGVSFDGPKISRHGMLSWVCISTPFCVFLFDIELLGKSAFDNGLRDIFQSNNIEKIIHDCRQESDCLSHLFNTQLVNVYDTQVADYFINMHRNCNKPLFKNVSSLDCCLVNYLGVSPEFIGNRRKNLTYADEVNFFKTRPISNHYQNALIKNALYLILLKKEMAELMMNPYRKAVDVYLNVLASASEPEMLLESSVSNMLPPALVMQGIKTVSFQEVPVNDPPIPHVYKLKDLKNKTIIESRKPAEVDTKGKVLENTIVDGDTNVSKKFSEKNSEVASYNKEKFTISSNAWKTAKNSSHSVIIEKDVNSENHIDNVHNKLVNSLYGSSVSKHIHVKPSKDNVIKQLFPSSTVEEKTLDHHQNVNSDAKSNSSSGSSSNVTFDSSLDCSDTWSRLRAAFGVSAKTLNTSQVHFLPAGMPL